MRHVRGSEVVVVQAQAPRIGADLDRAEPMRSATQRAMGAAESTVHEGGVMDGNWQVQAEHAAQVVETRSTATHALS